MNHRPYLAVSGALFALVAVGHLLRAANGWAFRVGTWNAPLAASWAAVAVAGSLTVWALRLLRSG